MEDTKKEVKMARAEEERKAVGLTPEEVREINEPRESKSKSKISTAANVLAASLTAVAGVGPAAEVEGALKSSSPPRVQEAPELDPLNQEPPPGITFSQDTGKKDGGVVEPILTKRVFLPNVTKEAIVRYHLPKIGNLKEDGVTINHAGTLMNPEVGFELMDYELYKQTLGRLAKVCRPNGIEWFIYNARSGDTMSPEPAYYYLDLRRGYQQYDTWFGVAGGFLQNSTLLIGRRLDGVSEVHLGLFLKPGELPTAEELYKYSWGLITGKVSGYTMSDSKNPDEVSIECRTAREEVFQLLYERLKNKQSMPIQLIIK